MNKIFRIVWNKSLRQFMVASELARSSRASCTVDRRHGMNLSGMLARGALAAALLAAAPLALAHTTSVGYVAPLGTSHTVTFWYGTYHTVADDGVSGKVAGASTETHAQPCSSRNDNVSSCSHGSSQER